MTRLNKADLEQMGEDSETVFGTRELSRSREESTSASCRATGKTRTELENEFSSPLIRQSL